ECAALHDAGVVEPDLRAQLPGQQAATGGQGGAGGIEIAAFAAAQGRQRAAQRQVGERLRLRAGRVRPDLGLRRAGATADVDTGGDLADLAFGAQVDDRVADRVGRPAQPATGDGQVLAVGGVLAADV